MIESEKFDVNSATGLSSDLWERKNSENVSLSIREASIGTYFQVMLLYLNEMHQAKVLRMILIDEIEKIIV